MPRGQADYGMYASKAVGASVSDMGEIAARLGSIVTYDKRGDVVDFDNFEGPVLSWLIEKSPAANYARLTSESVRSGAQAVALYASSDAVSYTRIRKNMPVLGSKKLGVEISFSYLGADTLLRLACVMNDGSYTITSSLQFDSDTGILYVSDDTGAWLKVADSLSLRREDFNFSTLKLVADFDACYYKRVMLDNIEWDISSIAMQKFAAVTAAYLSRYVEAYNQGADAYSVFIDDFIFTQAEP